MKLRDQVEVTESSGKTTALTCKEAATTEQACYRWREEYDVLHVGQTWHLKKVEQENAKLKRLVAEQSQTSWF